VAPHACGQALVVVTLRGLAAERHGRLLHAAPVKVLDRSAAYAGPPYPFSASRARRAWSSVTSVRWTTRPSRSATTNFSVPARAFLSCFMASRVASIGISGHAVGSP